MKNRRINEPIVSITHNQLEQLSIVEAINLLPIDEIIKQGDRVVITPNWVKAKPPYTATVVGPQTLQKLIQYIKTKNPASIIVATGSGGDDTLKVFQAVGYDKIIQEENIEFVDLNYGPYIELELEHDIIKTTKMNKLLQEIDVLISFTQLKQHEEATVSASIKNIALGWPPAEIHGFPKKKLGIHEDLHGFIAAITKKIPVDLAIVSLDKTMIGTGPSNGKAVNTEGLMIAATDALAADAIGARLLGFLPQAVQYIYKLYKEGVGEVDPKKMTIKGLTLEEAEKLFSKAAYGQEIVLDQNNVIKNIHGTQ
ncbi:DUF362 domain-containing protein [Clostridium formicaceticum]|uniref:(Fe-S)-binding protein n=1 Tax=Clostridium formicaceticum TaxID=1497 RepID=A0AAC9RJN8_9CLOT|nr:DUF362 domain-containing protein [Clostridium formicaceticum]AOY76356.1 (Fe-S)-binding protein [Clostridium formicaceticum]ARE86747.1 hypothetical protein CLFO_10740 [Clostridium formicaceticum]